MKSADSICVVGWLASQTDMLADDWEIVKPKPFAEGVHIKQDGNYLKAQCYMVW